ncbi:hypothetical protein [Oceanobacillus kapialis]|uniref:Uncharacterized protein n=1 Tax=Oceanobacillus kapialis TaxID=481353 RepID=A0ABW5PXI9_9BACI
MPNTEITKNFTSQYKVGNEITEKEYILFKEQAYSIVGELLELLEQESEKSESSRLRLNELNKRIDKLESEKSNLQKELESSKRQLNALKDSKLGKLTRSYWKFRKKLKGAK